MSHILQHFSFQPVRWNGSVIFILGVVWLMVLGCVISSIFAQQFDRSQRIFWLVLVVAVPIVGVLSYLPFAFRKEELPQVLMRKPRSKKKKRSESGVEL